MCGRLPARLANLGVGNDLSIVHFVASDRALDERWVAVSNSLWDRANFAGRLGE
jgi:hypothetical protein